MTITAFDATNLKLLRKDINDALATIAAKHGIDLSIGNISYSTEQFSTRLTVTTRASSAAPEDANGLFAGVSAADINAFKRYATMIGLEESDLGKEFTERGTRYAIVGYLPRSTKYPVLVKILSSGEQRKFTLDSVRKALGKKREQPISLTEFTKQVNDLSKAEVEAKNRQPGAIFGAVHHEFNERSMQYYYDEGFTPTETLRRMEDEAVREMRAEARAS